MRRNGAKSRSLVSNSGGPDHRVHDERGGDELTAGQRRRDLLAACALNSALCVRRRRRPSLIWLGIVFTCPWRIQVDTRLLHHSPGIKMGWLAAYVRSTRTGVIADEHEYSLTDREVPLKG